MEKKILLSDIDGVLLNWVDGFNAWLNKNFESSDQDINLKKDNHTSEVYCISTRYNIPKDMMQFYIKMFNQSIAFGHLDEITGASRAVHSFIDSGWEVHTVSSYSRDLQVVKARLENLGNVIHKSLYDAPHRFHELDESKLETYMHYIDTHSKNCKIIFVDDKHSHVEDALNNNIESYLFTQPYNLSSDLPRVAWDDLVERFT